MENGFSVSIIVPVYKVEKYLEKCLDSIAAQTYQKIEVILVDDGSPDTCGAICDWYAKQDLRFRVIHQKNQGLSAARNNAVPESTGDYIAFIDSDDYVTPDYVEYLVHLIKKYNADISVGGFIYQYDDRAPIEPGGGCREAFLSREDALSKMNYGQGFSVFAWGKMYRRDLVERYPYPTGKLYEDLATTYKLVGNSSGIAYGNRQIYYWIQRSGSIMHNKFNERQYDGLDAAHEQLRYIEENYPTAIPAARYRYTAKAVELMANCFSSGGDPTVFRKLKEHMNRYAGEVLKDSNVKQSMKLRIRAVRLGYGPARFAFWVHERMKRAKA